MAEISDVRQLFYNALKTFAQAQSPALRIEADGTDAATGDSFKPNDTETWLEFHFKNGRPSKPYAGFKGSDRESGFCQINVFGPEERKRKAFEKIAWNVRDAFWPTASGSPRPTLGTTPRVLLGPTAPHVEDHPAPGEGRLGSICTIYWHSDFPKS